MKTKIILVARDCDSSAIVYNYLSRQFTIDFIIFENTISRKEQFLKRVKRLGFLSAVSQVLFVMLISPFIKLFSQKRKSEIFRQFKLNESQIPEDKVIRVETLNSEVARNLLKKLNPDLILVNGTRIISKKTLDCTTASFVNIHVGITPIFRGVHGGYWAVAIGKKELFGTTIHYVDKGIDTGGIIDQVFAKPDKRDNYFTYSYLQYAIVLPALEKVVESFANGEKPNTINPVTHESAIWFHPTISQWLKNMNRTFVFIFPILLG